MKRKLTFSEARFSTMLGKMNIFKVNSSNVTLNNRNFYNEICLDFDQFLNEEETKLIKFSQEQNLCDEIEISEEFKRKIELKSKSIFFVFYNQEIQLVSIDHLECQKDLFFKYKNIKYSTICIDISKKNLTISSFVLTPKFLYIFNNNLKQINEEWNFDDHWILNINPYTKIPIEKIEKIFTNSIDRNVFALKYKSEYFIFQCFNLVEILDILSKMIIIPFKEINNFDECIVNDFKYPTISIGSKKKKITY